MVDGGWKILEMRCMRKFLEIFGVVLGVEEILRKSPKSA
jgi:hypothetical protein